MIEILSESSESALGFKVSGKIMAADYDVMLPKIDEAIAVFENISLLVVMGELEGYEGLDAAKDDFKFGTEQYRQVTKAAFIGDKKWIKWMVKIMDPFTRRTDERFYKMDQLEKAWRWVKEK